MQSFFNDEKTKCNLNKLKEDIINKKDLDQSYATFRISSEFLDCSLPAVLDMYNMCSGNCYYCFAYVFKSQNGAFNANNFKSINLKKLEKIIKGKDISGLDLAYHEHFVKQKKVIQIGSMSDMFDDFEKKHGIGYEALKMLLENDIPVRISTKFLLDDKYLKLLEDNKNKNLIAFMYSIVTSDDKIAAEVEEDIPSVTDRFKQLKVLGDMGYWTILRLRPFIMGISDKSLDDLLTKLVEYKIRGISTEWYCLDGRSKADLKRRNNQTFSKYLNQDFMDYYKKLSSTTNRKSYQRLNRDVKEIYIRKMYKHCVDNGIHFAVSDPDYKELNMSGSCCALPNLIDGQIKDIANYNRMQMTNLLRLSRKKFWRQNTVDDVLNNKVTDLIVTLEDLLFLNSDENNFLFKQGEQELLTIYKREILASERYNYKPFDIMKKYWNSVDTSCSFTNYFDYKLLPIKKDKNGNLVYKYQVLPYEILWQDKFGIDLKEN